MQLNPQVSAYLVEDPSLPWIQLKVFMPQNTSPQKPEEVAAVSLLDVMYRRGGSDKFSATVVDDTLEFLAAGIAGNLGVYHSTLELQSLSEDFGTVLEILQDVYFKPTFDSTRLELQKTVYLQNLKHRYDRPADLLRYLHRYAMYQSNARTWSSLETEVSAVSREDLVRLSADRFSGIPMVIAISGNFQRDSMLRTLQKWVQKWPKATEKPNPTIPLIYKNKPGIYVCDKEATQANIRMEQPFVKRPHPDYYPTAVASYILGGGGFTSRLTTRVRSDEGLAYSVYSYARSDYDEIGNTGIALQTKVESAAYALQIIRQEVQKLAAEGPTEKELLSAQQSLVESLPGTFNSPHATAQALAQSQVWGRSPEHFKEFPAQIQKVSADDVKRCIKKYFDPTKMTVSIVGPLEQLQMRDTVNQVELDSLGWGDINIVSLDSLTMR